MPLPAPAIGRRLKRILIEISLALERDAAEHAVVEHALQFVGVFCISAGQRHILVKKSRADQRLLLSAAILHPLIAAALHLLPLGLVRRGLGTIGALGSRGVPVEDPEVRVVRAAGIVASLWPGENCLTEALVAQCLLARYRCETTLCFGVSRTRPDGRPIDAHAWLERDGICIVGARAAAYEPLRHAARCAS